MANLKQVKQKLDEAKSLLLITQALSEVSSVRLKRIRNSVERNAFFFAEITKVYRMVKIVADARKIILPKNGRRMSILITSNYRFYGDLNTKLIKYFLEKTHDIETDIIIIGTTASDYLKGIKYNKRYQFFDLAKDFPNDNELKLLVSIIQPYSEVLVYHSQFKSVLTQIPTTSDITQSARAEQVINKKDLNYIFEPEIEKILNFFDAQVTTLLLEETFLESELSHVAARLIATSRAEDTAEKHLEDQKKVYANARRMLFNTNLLESLSSFEILRLRHGEES